MIAYNKEWLSNLGIHQQVEKAMRGKCMDETALPAIHQKYPVDFYTPNPFIRVGLFILTVIIAVFTFGLIVLMFFNSAGIESMGLFTIFLGLATCGLLEWIVTKRHFQSGVDDALLWISFSFILGGLNALVNMSAFSNAVVIFILSLYGALRFVDRIMGMIACLSLLAMIFLAYIKAGPMAKVSAPFLLMLMSGMIYLFNTHLKKQNKWRLYKTSYTLIEITNLLSFYLAGNFFIVREASNTLFDLNLKGGESIPFGWLFWILTFVVPLIYLIRGIQKKDAQLLRVGLLSIAVTVFSVRYYHHIMPLELAMIAGGLILTGIAYALISYLREPKFGFTGQEPDDKIFLDKLQVEALVMTETFGPAAHPSNSPGTSFGGGSGGGGGASGDF